MYSKFVKLCSVILTIALLINLLPMQVLGEEFQALLAQTENVSSNVVYDNEVDTPSDATIIGETIEKRTEFSKEYKLSNGMNMVVVYPEAVHFSKDASWEEIDNTLVSDNSRSIGTYRNKNNSWDVSLPRQLSTSNKVTVEKDGYIVSFRMAGEKRQYTIRTDTKELAVLDERIVNTATAVQESLAQVVPLNYEEEKSMSAHPETIADTLKSRLRYSNAYQNTDIQYDLNSYQLKESIILRSYNSVVQGYDFSLETGGLIPVLLEDNSIELQTTEGETIMTLPAPYMIDNNGAISKDVDVTLTPSTGGYLLGYQMPMEWLAAVNRAWPVVLDPIIVFDHYRQNIKDQFVAEYYYEDYNHGAMYCGYNQSYGRMRSFLKYVNIPDLTSADVVVHAELSLYRLGGSVSLLPIEVHKVERDWDSQDITWNTQPAYNPIIEDYCNVGDTGSYSWEITDIVKDWYKGGILENNTGLMLKASDSVENGTTNFWKKFYTIDYDVTEPAICPRVYIYIKNSNGLESYWDYTTTSAGRAGTGYVNNYSGNLTWIRNDIGFGGNRMPVTINHVYNTNDINDETGNVFGLGYGWRTNYNQTIYQWEDNNYTRYYVWEDGDGTKHYFGQNSEGKYVDEDGLELEMSVSDNEVTIEDKNGNTSCFSLYKTVYQNDGNTQKEFRYFRLHSLTNNQATQSHITITYSSPSSLWISTITDGAGRVYNFTYTNNLLSKISYVGKVEEGQTSEPEEISYVTFGYTDSNLTSVTNVVDQEEETCLYTYSDNYLTSAQEVDGYKIVYTYLSGIPKRIGSISEWDGAAEGGSMTIEYAHNQTTFMDHNENVQILQFNDWGNVTAIQDDQGNAQYTQYNRNDYHIKDTSRANQMSLSSKMQNTVSNLLPNNSFESNSVWTASESFITVSRSQEQAYLGAYSLKVSSTQTAQYRGAYSGICTIEPGQTITFSAYVKTVDAAAELAIIRRSDWSAFRSEVIPAGKDWARYQVSYTNNSTATDSIQCLIHVNDPGAVYMDCVQAEYAPTASRYNIIENGDFRFGANNWIMSNYCDSDETPVTMSKTAAPQLNATAFRIVGDPTNKLRIRQEVPVSGVEGDTYVLAGWAKGNGVPLLDRADGDHRTFTIRGTFMYTDDTTGEFNFDFNPDTDGNYWQYCAGVMLAEKAYSGIKIQVLYDYGANTVYFDGIQLFKETFGTSYDYGENETGKVISVVDLQKQTTTYQFDTQNNLTQIIQNNKAQMKYKYDTHHNVIKAITQKEDANGNIVDGIVYEFTYDDYGNNTLVKVTSGGVSMSTSATYEHEGNHLETTTDTLAKITKYCYNEDTSVLEWVQYPNDTDDSKTTYTYDDLYRMVTASQSVPGLSEGTALTASYEYDGDLLKKIQTASTTYEFYYGTFGLRTGVRIGDRWLVYYEYSEDLNRDLTTIEYANRQLNIYRYDEERRLIEEIFDDGSTIDYTYDNTGALSTMTDSATGRKTTYYYDLIDRLGKYKETGPNGYEHSVTYTYDERNNLSKLVETINGVEHTTQYTYDYENRLTETDYGDTSETVRYDAFGRLSGTSTKQDEETVVYSWTQYASGSESNTTTTRLQMFGFSSSMDYMLYTMYQYDGNGNITSAIGSVDYIDDPDGYFNTISRVGASFYYYDAANQLIREDNYWLNKTFVWTYDNAGNITSRKEYPLTYHDEPVSGTPTATYTYTYGDSSWGDLLTAYNGVARTYDGVGNLLTDGTWTYTWQNGRELASMTDGATTWNYVYDANGMRISRTNGTKTYNYVYNGSQLTQMTVSNDTLYFTYGILGPTTVTWNGTTYYYALNAQGDVIGIYDEDGNLVVVYNWDNAWGYNPIPEGSLANTLGTLNPLRYRSYVYDTETGYYYLQSRYYDPEIGRFINADALISTGQGFLGNNMYAYCLNNPVSYADYSGYLPYFGGQTNINATLYGSNDSNIYFVHFPSPPIWGPIEPSGDAEPGTTARGLTGNVSFGVSFSFCVGFTYDHVGNIGLILNVSSGGGCPSVGLGEFVSRTNCPTIYDQQGKGLSFGGGINVGPVGIGTEYNVGMNDRWEYNGYSGYTVSATIGIGVPGDVHGTIGETWVIGFNIYEVWNNFYYWATQ